MKKVFSFPAMGIYSDVFANMLNELNVDYIMPPKVTKKTIDLGVKHSPEMVCFPFKVALGSMIESVQKGANTIVSMDTQGQCRYRHFLPIHQQIIKKIGYECDILPFVQYKMYSSVKTLNPKNSYFKIFKVAKNTFKLAEQKEKSIYPFKFSKDEVNIGIVGEIYTLHEPGVNHNIIKELQNKGVNVDVSYKVTDYIKKAFKWKSDSLKKERKMSYKYLRHKIGGHARESLVNSIHYGRKGYDGIIHILPLTCMPETTIQPLMDMISEKYEIPIYTFTFDENHSEVGFKTRLETFVDMIKERKRKRNEQFRN